MSTVILSDKSVIGDLKKASKSSRKKEWTDLDLNLTLHPIRKDIVPLRDDAAIRYAVKNLLLTNFYERPFNLAVGANLRGLLFEPADSITKAALKENIERTITEHEQRVQLVFVDVQDDPDNYSYRILVKFRIKEFDATDQVEIVLKRLR